ncbi:SRPBCC family protein [Kineococcus sp. T13]|nr:SRPBCC family protein [Kineococcus vitellinus]
MLALRGVNSLGLATPVELFGRARVGSEQGCEVVVRVLRRSLVPGVAGTSGRTGPWDGPGSSRTPRSTDGSQATETSTEHVPGHSFAYELTDSTNVLGRSAACVRGEWSTAPDGSGTAVRWTSEFEPRLGGGVR